MNYKQAKYYIIKGVVTCLYNHLDSPSARRVLANLNIRGAIVDVSLRRWRSKSVPYEQHSATTMGVSIPCYKDHFLVEADVEDKLFKVKIFDVDSKFGVAGLLDMYQETTPYWFIKLLRVNNEEHYIT